VQAGQVVNELGVRMRLIPLSQVRLYVVDAPV
jgi:hypothetical protein